jgi:hypothetical protein
MPITLKILATGRRYGDKREADTRNLTINGVQISVVERDIWEGPVEAGEEGRYFRQTEIVGPARHRDDRLGWSAVA